MSRLLSLSAVVVLVAGLSGCKTAEESLREAGNQPLSKTQAQEVLSGNTFDARNVSGQAWFEYHAPDGTLYAGDGDSWLKTGEWWVNDAGEYCLTMPGWNNATNRCQPIYKVDAGYRTFWQDGRPYMTVSVMAGDAKDLAPGS